MEIIPISRNNDNDNDKDNNNDNKGNYQSALLCINCN